MTQLGDLQEIGAATGNEAEFTLRLRDGSTSTVRIAPEAVTRPAIQRSGSFRPGYVYANADGKSPAPLYQRNVNRR